MLAKFVKKLKYEFYNGDNQYYLDEKVSLQVYNRLDLATSLSEDIVNCIYDILYEKYKKND